jgi:hypothetical protein
VEKYSTARQATDDNLIRRMRFACWITKATDTHSECVTIVASSKQQWLRESASIYIIHKSSLLLNKRIAVLLLLRFSNQNIKNCEAFTYEQNMKNIIKIK